MGWKPMPPSGKKAAPPDFRPGGPVDEADRILISRILCPSPPRRRRLTVICLLATRTRGYFRPAFAGRIRAGGPFPLLCLAPHGVYPAPFLAVGAVSSYLAISPLPLDKLGAVFFLRHFPSIPIFIGTSPSFDGHAALRCSDFPLATPACGTSERPSPILPAKATIRRNGGCARNGTHRSGACVGAGNRGGAVERRARAMARTKADRTGSTRSSTPR